MLPLHHAIRIVIKIRFRSQGMNAKNNIVSGIAAGIVILLGLVAINMIVNWIIPADMSMYGVKSC